jgi:dethiobiotin synthetase
MRNIFVTGTDTGVGKTVVTAALVSLARAGGIDAVPMKPVQTGCVFRDGAWDAPDISFVLGAAGLNVSSEEQRVMCPYRFELPCSPHLAAEKAGSEIAMDTIVECFHTLAKRHEMVVVEGAGGILVPVHDTVMMIDIMKRLDLPVVLVSRPGLGTLNHTLLSLHELQRWNIAVVGVIFCDAQPASGDYIERDNKATIERLGGVSILGTMPYITEIGSIIEPPDRFLSFCKENLPEICTGIGA